MKNFWLSCGHILTDRDAGGGLLVTDELLKAYLARPELKPPLQACAAERRLHEALFEEPRRRVAGEEIAAITLKDRPIVYLYHRDWLWAYTNKLSGLRTVPDGLVRLQGLRFN